MIKPSETKYAKLVEQVRNIHIAAGFDLYSKCDDYGLNTYYPTKDGKIIFNFYWDGLSEILTPDGLITPLGSRSHRGTVDTKGVQQELIDTFGLVLVETKNGMVGERWYKYEMTKELPE